MSCLMNVMLLFIAAIGIFVWSVVCYEIGKRGAEK